jgi:HEAT repeat protein
VTALLAALKDEYEFVRRAAAQALGTAGAGSAEVVTALLAALKDAGGSVQSAAWESLWRLVQV